MLSYGPDDKSGAGWAPVLGLLVLEGFEPSPHVLRTPLWTAELQPPPMPEPAKAPRVQNWWSHPESNRTDGAFRGTRPRQPTHKPHELFKEIRRALATGTVRAQVTPGKSRSATSGHPLDMGECITNVLHSQGLFLAIARSGHFCTILTPLRPPPIGPLGFLNSCSRPIFTVRSFRSCAGLRPVYPRS